jgi:CRISPR/Cas system-associated exonuclease Cas4 (RecB family)
MKPPFDFAEVVLEEIARGERDYFSLIGEDIAEALSRDQDPGLRISDVASCSLALWGKVNGELTIPEDPQTMWSRLQLGTIVGAVIARYFKAAMDRRGVRCVLEGVVEYKGMSGHLDIALPEYRHLYELKSNYNVSKKEAADYHVLQAGMYANALEELGKDGEWSASIVMIQPAITGDRPRMIEYPVDDFDFHENASREADRLVRAAKSSGPPPPDVPKDQAWRCKTCRYARCSLNKNPRKVAA